MYKTFDIFEDFRNIDEIKSYWLNAGFPHRDKNEYDLKKELDKVRRSSVFDYETKKFKKSMNGCGVLWTYFKHWVEVECNDSPSVIDCWNDYEKFSKLIEKTYKYELKHNNRFKFSVNRLRQNAKVYCAKQSVSNFRPTVAKDIYNKFGNKGTVWDMSCGWGGRLLGFAASDCKRYIGTEPSELTFNGLNELSFDLKGISDKEIELYKLGSEVFLKEKESVDLCFTSPPYFNTEKYSDEESQSYLKFAEKEEWSNGFLKKTFENCYYALKKGGHMVINIANVKSYKDLEEVTVKKAVECGFELEDTLFLVLSSISGKGEKKEPIFVFKKN